jgi:hypothetical protein
MTTSVVLVGVAAAKQCHRREQWLGVMGVDDPLCP